MWYMQKAPMHEGNVDMQRNMILFWRRQKKKKKREGGKGAGAEHCGHQCPYDAPIHDNYKFDTTATIIATRRADQAFWFPVRNRVVAALLPGAAVAAGYDV